MKTLIEHWQLATLAMVVLLLAVYVAWDEYVTPVLEVFGWVRKKAKGRKEKKADDDLEKLQDDLQK